MVGVPGLPFLHVGAFLSHDHDFVLKAVVLGPILGPPHKMSF